MGGGGCWRGGCGVGCGEQLPRLYNPGGSGGSPRCSPGTGGVLRAPAEGHPQQRCSGVEGVKMMG